MSDLERNWNDGVVVCQACRRELPAEASFCGYCGFHLTPLQEEDRNSLSQKMEALEVDSPILLTEVKKVLGKGAQHLRKDKRGTDTGRPETPPPPSLAPGKPATMNGVRPAERARETGGPRAVIRYPEPPVRPLPTPASRQTGAGAVPPTQRVTRPTGPQPPVRGPAPSPARGTGALAKASVPGQVVRRTGASPVPAPPPKIQLPAPAAVPVARATNKGKPESTTTQDPAMAETIPASALSSVPVPDHHPSRRYRRFPLNVEVGYASEHNFYTGFLENLSSGGLFVATHQPGEIGDVMEVTFSVPGLKEPCVAICQVTWIREYNAGAPDTIPGMGLRFIQLEPTVRAAVELFIRHREPIFFDAS